MSSIASLATSEKNKKHNAHVDVLQRVDEDDLHEAEVGYDIYLDAKEGLEWEPEEEKRVLSKIDLWVLPAFCLTQGLAFLDKTALNYGNLFGMQKYVSRVVCIGTCPLNVIGLLGTCTHTGTNSYAHFTHYRNATRTNR